MLHPFSAIIPPTMHAQRGSDPVTATRLIYTQYDYKVLSRSWTERRYHWRRRQPARQSVPLAPLTQRERLMAIESLTADQILAIPATDPERLFTGDPTIARAEYRKLAAV